MSRALLPSWMAESQPGPGPALSERAEMAGRLARHPLVMDVTAAAAVAAGTGLIDAFGSHHGGVVGWDLLLAAPPVFRRRPACAAALIGSRTSFSAAWLRGALRHGWVTAARRVD